MFPSNMASSSRNNEQQFFELGSIIKLFKFQTSVVLLMDYDKYQTTRMLGIGQFVLYLMLNNVYPVMITACSINGFNWPITKDTVIFRMAKRTFAFAFPGLLYGLQFPNSCEEAQLDKLEKWFIKFGHYFKVIEDKQFDYSLEDNDQHLWYKLRRCVEPKAHEILTKLGQLTGKSRLNISNENSSYLRSIRLSAITKLVVHVMVRSSKLNHSHIIFEGTNPSPHQPDGLPMSQHMAYASISVFISILDKFEYENDASGENADGLVAGLCPSTISFKVWSFSEEGLKDLIVDLSSLVQKEERMMRENAEEWKAKEKEMVEANNFATAIDASASGCEEVVGRKDDKGKSVN